MTVSTSIPRKGFSVTQLLRDFVYVEKVKTCIKETVSEYFFILFKDDCINLLGAEFIISSKLRIYFSSLRARSFSSLVCYTMRY
jgi:hypothetical protein